MVAEQQAFLDVAWRPRHRTHQIDIAVPQGQSPLMFKRFWWVFLVTAGIGPVVGLITAAAVSYVMPKLYESEAVIEIKPGAEAMTPQYFATEFEKIKGHHSLGLVVDKLALNTRWGVDKDTAVRILQDHLSTRNFPGTDLVSIRARLSNKFDARDIASEVSRSYMAYRTGMDNLETERVLHELDRAVEDQKNRVQERKAACEKLTKDKEPHPSLLPHNEAADTPQEAATRAQGLQDLADAKRDLQTEQELLKSMELERVMVVIARNKPPVGGFVSEPEINDSPVSPDVTLNLTIGPVFGFLLSPLLALPLIVLLNRQKAR